VSVIETPDLDKKSIAIGIDPSDVGFAVHGHNLVGRRVRCGGAAACLGKQEACLRIKRFGKNIEKTARRGHSPASESRQKVASAQSPPSNSTG
jgi:hypothetical protein